MGKLEGKVALITGGNSGIGLATAKQSVHEGAYVFVTGRRDSELAAAVKEIGRNVTGVQGDVSSLGDWVKSHGCWITRRRRTRVEHSREYRDSAPTRDRRSWGRHAIVPRDASVHFRSFWTTDGVTRVTAGATR